MLIIVTKIAISVDINWNDWIIWMLDTMNFIPNRYYRWNTIEYTIQLLSNARIKLKLDCLKRAFSNRNQSNDTQDTSWIDSSHPTKRQIGFENSNSKRRIQTKNTNRINDSNNQISSLIKRLQETRTTRDFLHCDFRSEWSKSRLRLSKNEKKVVQKHFEWIRFGIQILISKFERQSLTGFSIQRNPRSRISLSREKTEFAKCLAK